MNMNASNQDNNHLANMLHVGVDLGKFSHFGTARTLEGHRLPVFEFANDRDGFTYLWKQLQAFAGRHQLAPIRVGVEPTGTYGTPLMYFLEERGAEVVLLNPKHSKRVNEIRDNSPHKHDRKDPTVLVDMLMLGCGQRGYCPAGRIAELRALVKRREEVLDDSGRTVGRIEAQLAEIFPEYWTLMGGVASVSSRQLLRTYPGPTLIGEAGVDAIAALLVKTSRGKLGRSRARRLVKAGKQTAGMPTGRSVQQQTLRARLDHLQALAEQRRQLRTSLQQTLEGMPDAWLLQSLPGLGVVTAAVVLAEVGDFRQYPTQLHVLKLAGLNLYEQSSGTHQGIRRISKRGRARLRHCLYVASVNMVKTGGIYHPVYRRHRAKGMPATKALTAVSRKLLVTLYAMVRDGQHFDPDRQPA